ncbi:MAG: methyltransferase domain-containing protein [Kiritimatiellae bacterium]|nr:methyltransferase domain-containing protein [Kiritimatiellia bacterium]
MSDALRHLRSTHARFNRGAARYDLQADVQRETAARLVEHLADIEEPLRILDAGCGSGILTRLLLERFPRSRVDAFDISEAMLDTARAHISAPCVRWLQSEFALFRPALPYPLVVSNASLHWAPSLCDAMENLANCLAPGGLLAVSLMVEGTLRELRESLARVVPAKSEVGPMPTLAELRLIADQLGLRRVGEGEYAIRRVYPSASELLRGLHDQGLTGGVRYRPVAPLVRGELAALVTDYDRAHAVPEGGVIATYAVAWLLARRLH